jgi:hypothetical protein
MLPVELLLLNENAVPLTFPRKVAAPTGTPFRRTPIWLNPSKATLPKVPADRETLESDIVKVWPLADMLTPLTPQPAVVA